MPPKKFKSKDTTAKEAVGKSSSPDQARKAPKHTPSDTKFPKPQNTSNSSRKRKAPTTSTPNKAPRRSARGNISSNDPVKLLNYLLSPSSLHLTRPKDETSDLSTLPHSTRTYSTSLFTPFEELVCAVILSRPIGHMLGLRSIRTLFNEPYKLTTPKAVREAGTEGCRAALDKARTQHRQKTAEELVGLADAVAATLGSGEEDVGLERVRRECGHDAESEREMLKKNVKGLGKTGLDIFGRRIQGVWQEWWPFVDERTLGALGRLGLPRSAEGLVGLVEEHLGELEVGDLAAGGDKETKKRMVFMRILERAVGADLEGNTDAVRADAG